MKNKLTIGQLAKLAGVNVETIRYYERSGIIRQPVRRNGSYREYSHEIVQKVRFIKRAQYLGLKLSEISEILNLLSQRRTTPRLIREKADLKLLQVRQMIADLQRIEQAVLRIKECCEKQAEEEACPIFDRFFENQDANVFTFVNQLQ